jgi:hypothetical protein
VQVGFLYSAAAATAGLFTLEAVQFGSFHISNYTSWFTVAILRSKLAHFLISSCASWLTLQRCCSLSRIISHLQLCKLYQFTFSLWRVPRLNPGYYPKLCELLFIPDSFLSF